MKSVSESTKIGQKLAPFNPAGSEVVDIALELLQIKNNDVMYDLGCGDARIVVKACLCNPTIRGVGIEYDHDIYLRACDLVNTNNVADRVRILHDNVLNIDFSEATCIFVYLVPEGVLLLKDLLRAAIDRGVRVVTYVFSIPDTVPTEVRVYKGSTKIYLYTKAESV